MTPKLFLTGATGYIGGSILDALVKAHPEWTFTALLRNPTPRFSERYPNVHIVKGDYDSTDILADAASDADIVIHCGNSDHESHASPSSPAFYIHLGGTGTLGDQVEGTHLGTLNPKVWSDLTDIDTLTSLPPTRWHRVTDEIIQSAADAHGDALKCAIVAPSDIYGRGHGTGRTQSMFLPVFRDEILRVGAAFYAGDGTNTRSWVHVDDVAWLFVKLVEEAVAGGGNAVWGRQGYYFVSSSEVSQLELARATGKILNAQGLIPSPDPKQLSLQEIDRMLAAFGIPGLSLYEYAANSRSRPDRAKKYLGFEPKGPSLWDVLEADLPGTGDALVSSSFDGIAKK
ncbi:nucleoside-diphosphate-sugar epimerase [Punctularia strigosozonata HHB-11173 SS5]|uniref:nucleoside-diphosphate-sugar epimerase n=1 Tax=Punctularia strigosozonata (strain HHB-11173) TaxID=741275 RepID=UPI000441794D|nr:nucleoside-diphosphate-sugar epimerase [Punctularia strigosozonata HHB-11173 SS5]EIN09050.1 nucleoside-diphosphate-sugar epimerase [Punctularia strigosozonata HHB-11173 SS5]